MITSEQCRKWAEEVGEEIGCPVPMHHEIEALCQRVWDEAIDCCLQEAGLGYIYENDIRKLKVKP